MRSYKYRLENIRTFINILEKEGPCWRSKLKLIAYVPGDKRDQQLSVLLKEAQQDSRIQVIQIKQCRYYYLKGQEEQLPGFRVGKRAVIQNTDDIVALLNKTGPLSYSSIYRRVAASSRSLKRMFEEAVQEGKVRREEQTQGHFTYYLPGQSPKLKGRKGIPSSVSEGVMARAKEYAAELISEFESDWKTTANRAEKILFLRRALAAENQCHWTPEDEAARIRMLRARSPKKDWKKII